MTHPSNGHPNHCTLCMKRSRIKYWPEVQKRLNLFLKEQEEQNVTSSKG